MDKIFERNLITATFKQMFTQPFKVCNLNDDFPLQLQISTNVKQQWLEDKEQFGRMSEAKEILAKVKE